MHILHIGAWPKYETDTNIELQDVMAQHGITITNAPDLATGLTSKRKPDMILLGIASNSQRFIARIQDAHTSRQHTHIAKLPLVVLTTKPSIEQTTQGLNIGADDIIDVAQPHAVVVAKLEAIYRRAQTVQPSVIVRTGKLSINFSTHSAHIGAQSLNLTPREHALLAKLAENLDKNVSNDTLRAITNPPMDNNNLKVHMSKIKSKLTALDPKTNYLESRQNYGRRLLSIPVARHG